MNKITEKFSPIKHELLTARRLLLLNDAARHDGHRQTAAPLLLKVHFASERLVFCSICLELFFFFLQSTSNLIAPSVAGELREPASHVLMQSDEVQTRSPLKQVFL